ncbi:MAG: hypothetical protein EU517_00125 [Promethearchaeota archaeon]|nr:MAG: hypothetical protein EU517_00125 [Candidatus Lokiarchaeota archaeon]
MSDNNSNSPDLLLREILTEAILRDVILFTLFYIFLLTQGWDNLLLLIFPIVTMSFAVFFRIIGTNKKRLTGYRSGFIYNPLGAENRNADRLAFVSILQLILLFWIGAESIYHPQLISDFAFYFNISYFLIYSFGFFWIFLGIWNYCKVILDLSKFERNTLKEKQIVISELNFKQIKTISYANIVIFLVLNLLNVILVLIMFLGFNITFPHNLPGTGIEDSMPLFIPYTTLILLVTFPLVALIFLKIMFKNINNLSAIEFKAKISDLPDEIQTQITKNLKIINRKMFDVSFNE